MAEKIQRNGTLYSWYTCVGTKLIAWYAKTFLSIDVLCIGSSVIKSQKMVSKNLEGKLGILNLD